MQTVLSHVSEILTQIYSELKKHIIGQDLLLENLIITIFSGGHALIEGTPGLGKTKTIRAVASIFSLENKRISFTPDLLPSDLIGAEIFRPGKGEFEMRKGPIFTNIILADEINRTPPKVQSALLEAMEEKQVTIGTETFILPHPFFVFATQNPLENEGTYPLPEAQLDRFFMKISIEYPSKEDEKNILQFGYKTPQKITPIINGDEITEIQDYIQKTIKVDEKIYDYVVRILETLRHCTRKDIFFGGNNPLLEYGPSSRAGIALIRGSQVRAVMNSRDFVLPEDIKAIMPHILTHRIGLSYEALSEGILKENIIHELGEFVKILG